ncbi:MAG TPA: hypothetical protein ENL06_03045 [Candidatus Portnoybacteria bacterium]|nr:hypothetical protein [Candidatus Portnoybacteria bacterium]
MSNNEVSQKEQKPSNQVNNPNPSNLAKDVKNTKNTDNAVKVLNKIVQSPTSSAPLSKTKSGNKVPSKLTSGVSPIPSVSTATPKPASSNVPPTPPLSPPSPSPTPPKKSFKLNSSELFKTGFSKDENPKNNSSLPSNLFKKLNPKNSFSQSAPDSHSKTFSSAQSKKSPTSQGEILSSQNTKGNNFVKKFNKYRRHILYLSILLIILCDLWFIWVKKEESILAWIHLYYHHPTTVVQGPSSSKTTNFKLLIPAKSKTIDVLGLANLTSLINSLSQQFQSASIVVLRIKNENGDDVKMSLLNKALAINLPAKVIPALTGDYNLFVYLPTNNEKVNCQQALIAEKECFGPKLGLVFKLKNGQAKLVKDELDKIPMKSLIHNLTSIFLFNSPFSFISRLCYYVLQ